MKIRTITEYILGVKKSMLLGFAGYMVFIAIIVSSFSENSSLREFTLILLGCTLLLLYSIYWCYNEQRRLYRSLENSRILPFLVNQDFRVIERVNGWSYELDIQGYYNNCLVRVNISHERGSLWNKYFLNLEGVPLSKVEAATANGDEKIITSHYHMPIRLTQTDEALNSLSKHLSEFTNILSPDSKTTDNKVQP